MTYHYHIHHHVQPQPQLTSHVIECNGSLFIYYRQHAVTPYLGFGNHFEELLSKPLTGPSLAIVGHVHQDPLPSGWTTISGGTLPGLYMRRKRGQTMKMR